MRWMLPLLLLIAGLGLRAETTAPALRMYAVEFTPGAAWQADKPAHLQEGFKAHSANLAALRKEGRVRVGARYADKGLIVVAAASADEVRALFDKDPSVQAAVFAYTVNEMLVFYPGQLGNP
ncbi:YciI family protein [Chitinimonas sp. BJYL2]|uniref:YciI family protein n=1 Tax=Chitinimonas sp. BJYL2 TaxID=2976696 RepID=UPI0022B2F9F3|nr:YciI family protein [Chitinimonas sp. BJYL2]